MIEVVHEAKDGVGYVGALKRRGNTIWAVGGAWGSPLVMTSEGGATFRRRKPPDASGLRDVLLLGDKHALVVGEQGCLFETRDGESWRSIETGTKGCLFGLERAYGSMWLAGDGALVMSSADGVTWRKPPLGPHLQELRRIQRINHAGGALWFLGFTGKLGVLRKDQIELAPTESTRPLTTVAFSPRVGIVVGDGGTVFRTINKGRTFERVDVGTEEDLEDATWQSGRFVVVGAAGTVLVSEDGESFRAVETNRDDHLWSVLAEPGGVLVGGEGGLVLRIGKDSLAKAASTIAPMMTAPGVAALAETDAITAERVGPALYADDGSILVRAAMTAHRIREDRIEALPSVTAFGRSRDRKQMALAYADRIDVRQGLDGVTHTVIAIPTTIGTIKTLEVFPNGERLLVVSESGVWLVSSRGIENIHPAEHGVHAALSPDGRFIACGDRDSLHRIFVMEAGRFVLGAEVEPASPHPSHALFHDDGSHLCLSACDGASSSSLGLELDVLGAKKKKALRIAAGDYRVKTLSEGRCISSGVSTEDGYMLGDRDGDVWAVGFDGTVTANLHVEAIDAMDKLGDRLLLACGEDGTLVEQEGDTERRWVFRSGFPVLRR